MIQAVLAMMKTDYDSMVVARTGKENEMTGETVVMTISVMLIAHAIMLQLLLTIFSGRHRSLTTTTTTTSATTTTRMTTTTETDTETYQC